jgi:UDPglucose--hexose-1-phosphate uridylyltransferase
MLVDYAEQEVGGPRQVDLDDDWLVVAPFWGAWPYETMVIPRRPAARLADLDNSRRDSLAKRLIGLIKRYDNLFGVSLPYSMGWHQAPYGHESPDHWQLHAHFFPPLIQATTRKFMVGYELLSEPQRDITAESAAERLRASISSVAARPGSQS